jgi:hypothetical protein
MWGWGRWPSDTAASPPPAFRGRNLGHPTDVASLVRKRTAGEIVFLAALVIALILVAHIVFFALGANPANDIVRTVADWAGWLATWFDDLFQPANEKLEVFLNFGIAAVFFLIVGEILRRAVDRA